MQRGKWWLRTSALLAAGALVLAACGDDDEEATPGGGGEQRQAKTVAIAFVGPLTGDAANLGINIRDGMKLAVEEANEDDGDVTIEMKEFDTQGDPAQASTLKDKFINDDSIIGVVGPTFSGETKALLPDFDQAGLVIVSASATNVDLPNVVPNTKVFHRIIPDDNVQGAGLTQYISQNLKARRMGYVHDNTEYGKGLAEGTQKLMEAANTRTIVSDVVDPKAQDFSAAVNKVRAANPEVLFYGGYYAEAGRLKKQLSDAGFKGIFLSGDGALDPGFIQSSGAAGAEGAQITCPCNLATVDSPGKLGQFAKDYKALNQRDPGTYSTEGYDSANILIDGIKDGNDTRPKLLNYVETEVEDYDGVSKEISFEENGNVKASDVFIFQIKTGKIGLLGRTSELVGGGAGGTGATTSTTGG